MSTTVKLDYPVLSNAHETWIVRPGAGYRLFKPFQEASAIAPDVPLLDLPDGKLAKEVPGLEQQIRRGREWLEWEKDGANPEKYPSKSIGDYVLSLDDGIAHTRSLNTTIQILDDIPTGALIFVPGESLSDNALLGQVAAPSTQRVTLTRRWSDGKELRFLGRSLLNPMIVPMRLLPSEVTDLRKSRGLVAARITNEYARLRLYREYFQSFAIEGGDAYAQFRGGDAPFPAGALGNLVTLMRFVIEARIEEEAANAEGRPVKPINAMRIMQIAWRTSDDVLVHARVNSPFGRVTFQSIRISIFAATALVALAKLDADAQVIQDLASNSTQVENVCNDLASIDSAAQLQAQAVRQTLYDFYAIFGAQTCTQVLGALRETVEKTKGQVDAEAER